MWDFSNYFAIHIVFLYFIFLRRWEIGADLKKCAKNFVRLQRAAISCFPRFPPHIVTPSNGATRVRVFVRRRNAWQMSRSFFCIRSRDPIPLTLEDSSILYTCELCVMYIFIYQFIHQCGFYTRYFIKNNRYFSVFNFLSLILSYSMQWFTFK